MGYAQTTIIIWGVELADDEAKRIYDKLNKDFENREDDDDGELIPFDVKDCITDEVSYNRRGVDVFRKRDIPQLLADGTDSRIDNLCYTERAERHVIGIYTASKGYAHSDKIEDYIPGPKQRTLDNYEKYILTILKEEGIERKPAIQIVSQVW